MEDNTDTVVESTEESTSLLKDTSIKEEAVEEVVVENTMTDFVKTLDDDIRSNKTWEKFKSPQELARSYEELQKLVGRKGEIPKEDASDDDWSTFYGKAGRPETAGDYGIKPKEGLGDGEGRLNEALELAHKVGISQKQASVFFDGMMDLELAELNTFNDVQTQRQNAEATKLSEAWGNASDAMVDSVTNLEKSLGVFDAFEAKGLNNDADLLIMMAGLAERLGEDPEISNKTANTPAGLDNSISEVNSQIKVYLTKGEKVPAHLTSKREELFNRKYRE